VPAAAFAASSEAASATASSVRLARPATPVRMPADAAWR
jgi:hypothetical protein